MAIHRLETCSHHVDDPDRPSCDDTKAGKSMGCKKTCTEEGYGAAYGDDKHKADSVYSLSLAINAEESIQRDIMENGPVAAGFMVFSDFPAYKSGVYHYTGGMPLGGHAIKIIGWGVVEETGEKYWTVVNSWNEQWGDNGTFKIRRGRDECGIERMGAYAGKVSYNPTF